MCVVMPAVFSIEACLAFWDVQGMLSMLEAYLMQS